MVHKAKVFTSGNSQAVRLPKEYQFADQEVQIQRVGNAVILYPSNDPWQNFRNSLDQFSDDFLEDGRPPQGAQNRDMTDVFD
jgi:antitoxin VapB